MIARRRRMLAVFLNRLIRHPVLGRERVLWRFLSEDVAWSEVLHQAPLTDLPKNPLRAASHDPANTTLQAMYAHMPLPGSSSTPLQEPDRRFMDSEAFTQKFSAHLSGSLEKINRRLAKRWSEYAADQAELGGVLNGFALVEGGAPGDGSLKTQETAEAASAAIEKVGQAVDATYVATNALVSAYAQMPGPGASLALGQLQDWERLFTEQVHEYAQFSGVIKNLLRYRHMKHIQWEMTRDTLETKRVVLEDLERHESEAQRLEQALERVRRPTDSAEDAAPSTSASDHVIGASGPSILPQQKRAASFGFLGALRHSLNGMTDVDPEVSRRSSIGKNKDHIGHVRSVARLSALRIDLA